MADPAGLTVPAGYHIGILAGGERWSGRLTVHPPHLSGWISGGREGQRLPGEGRFGLDTLPSGRALRASSSNTARVTFDDVTLVVTFTDHHQGSATFDGMPADIDAPDLLAHLNSVLKQAQTDLDLWSQECRHLVGAGPAADAQRARALWERADRRLLVGDDADARRDASEAVALLRRCGYSPDADTTVVGNRLAGRLDDLGYADDAHLVRVALNR